MERSYLLRSSETSRGGVYTRFKTLRRFTEALCQHCDPECEGFLLTVSGITYDAHDGPRIGWGYYGKGVFMRLDNCESDDSIGKIEEFLAGQGVEVIEVPPEGPQ